MSEPNPFFGVVAMFALAVILATAQIIHPQGILIFCGAVLLWIFYTIFTD